MYIDVPALASRLVAAANTNTVCHVSPDEFRLLRSMWDPDELDREILKTGALTAGWGTEVRLIVDYPEGVLP